MLDRTFARPGRAGLRTSKAEQNATQAMETLPRAFNPKPLECIIRIEGLQNPHIESRKIVNSTSEIEEEPKRDNGGVAGREPVDAEWLSGEEKYQNASGNADDGIGS